MPPETSANNRQQRRVKVRLQFPEKLFHERVLAEWKDNITDNKNHSYVIRKALNNLKLFPLNVQGFPELRKIRGIGEDIATRLDGAWKHACDAHFANPNPSIAQVKALNRGQPFQLLAEAADGDGGRKRHFIPFVSKQRVSSSIRAADKPSKKTNGKNKEGPNNSETKEAGMDSHQQARARANSEECVFAVDQLQQMDYDEMLNISCSQPAIFEKQKLTASSPKRSGPLFFSQPYAGTSSKFQHDEMMTNPKATTSLDSDGDNAHHHVQQQESSSADSQVAKMLVYTPGETIGDARLLLIADNREGLANANGKKQGHRRGGAKGVVEHLAATNGVNCQSRTLSIGDYLWLLQWVDWEGRQQELVLDYIVERKTWDDLKRSIRETRYMEQKSRLRQCGLRNVIMVVEGGCNADRSLEQAMVSTGVENGFLTHRTQNMQSTAKFLQYLTKRLDERCKKEEVRGYSFEQFQECFKKPKPLVVSECWLRQLTVCPGMSIDRAQLICQQFPSFRSLVKFYRQNAVPDDDESGNGGGVASSLVEYNNALLTNALPKLPLSISKQINTFMQKALQDRGMED